MTTNIKHLRCLYATNCGMAEILYLRLVRTVFHDCKIAIIPKNEKLLTYVKSIINNWHEVIALHFQQLSLVQATNSNSRGDQSPFNLFDSPVALNPQPSSTMTMQEVTHSTTVPCSLNITLSQNHDSLNKSFLTTVAMVF